jgi:DNA-binding MarR family transcriptional regulator
VSDTTGSGLPEDLIEAISMLRRQMRASSGPRSPASSLTRAEIELVRLVRRQPATSVSEAANALGVAPNTVSTLVRRLDGLGWLSTSRDDDDRRVVRLTLKPAALRRVERWRDDRAAAVGAGLASLTAAQRRDLTRAVPALRALAIAVRGEGES